MKGNTIEEAYEVNQAVSDLTATGNPANLCEELGDLLLQVMLHSQIAEESGEFTLEDVIDGITRKMIRRHPHVFGGETYASDEERRAAWETIKEQEHREAQAAAAQSGPGDSGTTSAPSGLADTGRTTAQAQSGDAGAIAAELANVPVAFPALIRSQKVLKKAGSGPYRSSGGRNLQGDSGVGGPVAAGCGAGRRRSLPAAGRDTFCGK